MAKKHGHKSHPIAAAAAAVSFLSVIPFRKPTGSGVTRMILFLETDGTFPDPHAASVDTTCVYSPKIGSSDAFNFAIAKGPSKLYAGGNRVKLVFKVTAQTIRSASPASASSAPSHPLPPVSAGGSGTITITITPSGGTPVPIPNIDVEPVDFDTTSIS